MEPLHFYWHLIGLVVIFTITSIGLQHRTRWMWYLGWILMFVASGIMGAIFWTRMATTDTDPRVLTNGLVYLGVGLAIWVPVAVWWSTHQGEFGKKSKKENLPEGD